MSEWDDGFDAGILHQCHYDIIERRIQAFAAIRRSLQFARDLERSAEIDKQFSEWGAGWWTLQQSAVNIRYAIRLAIKSHKV